MTSQAINYEQSVNKVFIAALGLGQLVFDALSGSGCTAFGVCLPPNFYTPERWAELREQRQRSRSALEIMLLQE